MVIPFVHRRSPWELSPTEWRDSRILLQRLTELIDAQRGPDGWNVGWNVGAVGGQSVPHTHCHLIPRFRDEPYAGRGLRWWFKQDANRRP